MLDFLHLLPLPEPLASSGPLSPSHRASFGQPAACIRSGRLHRGT
jgi:hypothetical protein